MASLLDSATIWERPASTFRASFQRHRISFSVPSHLLERSNIDIPWFSSTCCCYRLKPFFLTSQHRVNLEIAPWILGGSQALHQRKASKPLRHWWTSARCLRDFTLWSVGLKGRQSDTVVYLEHLWHNHEYLNVWHWGVWQKQRKKYTSCKQVSLWVQNTFDELPGTEFPAFPWQHGVHQHCCEGPRNVS